MGGAVFCERKSGGTLPVAEGDGRWEGVAGVADEAGNGGAAFGLFDALFQGGGFGPGLHGLEEDEGPVIGLRREGGGVGGVEGQAAVDIPCLADVMAVQRGAEEDVDVEHGVRN